MPIYQPEVITCNNYGINSELRNLFPESICAMDQEWRRSDLVKFPATWATFNGRKVLDGKRRRFWIQDVDEGLAEDVIKYMTTQFVAEEPLSKYASRYCNSQ